MIIFDFINIIGMFIVEKKLQIDLWIMTVEFYVTDNSKNYTRENLFVVEKIFWIFIIK